MFGRSSAPPTPPSPPKPPAAANAVAEQILPVTTTPAHADGQTPPSLQSAPQSFSAPAPSTSVIAQDLRISGDKIIISCQSRLQVDGEIRGDLSGREIIVGETGSVSGSISAQSVEVRGHVDGAIHGAVVSLAPTARVSGDIMHKSLAISEGAQFDGRVRRAKSDDDLKLG